MDRHDIDAATTAEDTAQNHAADLEVAGEFDVEWFSYWHDAQRDVVICFARAPDQDSIVGAHKASHGSIPGEIIEVSENDVVRFLGKIHEPADASEVTSPFRTICFTDLVGSTALLDSLGQGQYMVLLTEHDLIVRNAIVKWKGREVKHTGDGFMVSFDDVGQALAWSLELQEAFSDHPHLTIRQGIAAGEPVDQNDDLFGAAVTLANRICNATQPNEIHTSDVVKEIAEVGGFAFDTGRSLTLKGFAEPATVFKLLGGT